MSDSKKNRGSTKSKKPYPLIAHFLNLDAIFIGGLLLPFYGKNTLIVVCLLIVFLNVAVLLGLRNFLNRLSTVLFRVTLVKNVALMVSAIIVFFGMLEYLARALTAYGIVKYHTPMITMLPAGEEDWRFAHITADKYRVPDPVLFWRAVNHSPYNSQGFKGRAVNIPKPPNAFRIICYGDSHTDGDKNGDWPRQLQKVLDEKIIRHIDCEVLNAGITGYTSYQGLLRFKQELRKYEPDLVFVSFGWNDAIQTLRAPDNTFKPPSPLIAGLQRVLLRYRFYLSIKYYLQKLMPGRKASKQPRVSLNDYISNMKAFLKIGHENNIAIVYLTRVYNLKRTPYGWRKDVPLYNKELLEFGKRENALVVDIQNIFETEFADLFVDECHISRDGQKKMAEVLYEQLLNSNMLPKCNN